MPSGATGFQPSEREIEPTAVCRWIASILPHEERLAAQRRLGTVAVMLHVVLAGPEQLHRSAHGLGHDHGLNQLVVHRPSAEAAAKEQVVDIHLLRRHTRRLRGELQGHVRVLGPEPDLDLVLRHPGRAVQGLHGGMGKMGDLVVRLDELGAGGCGGASAARASPSLRAICKGPSSAAR